MTQTKRVTAPSLLSMKKRGEKIAVLTAYDYTFASLMDGAGVDVLLVGDSLGMVVQGVDDTLPVTLDDVIYHTRAVCRGAKRALVVADMPFMSYQVSPEEALRNAGRLLKETGAGAVKLEGGVNEAETVRRIAAAGIPVMGHVGLGPQSIRQLGAYRVQGKTVKAAERLIEDARAIEEAGAFSLVIEAAPWPVAERVTAGLSIPTIGIGAGPHCDGQVLVYADMLGLFTAFQPHFVRRFIQGGEVVTEAFQEYCRAVKSGEFPSLDESYAMDEGETEKFLRSNSSEQNAPAQPGYEL
ncbi:MAG: 3-methyl-2-oxobutanoate hydroxymethyltransferase [bacterium]|nr:3-methyl-2-oxobutanoate hydroxymethyltransferase [bacterium]